MFASLLNLLVGAVALAAVTVANGSAPGELRTVPTVSTPASVAEQLLTEHDCWTGEAPANVALPGHAVVELDARRGPQYADSSVGFDIWQGTRDGHLYGFCR